MGFMKRASWPKGRGQKTLKTQGKGKKIPADVKSTKKTREVGKEARMRKVHY